MGVQGLWGVLGSVSVQGAKGCARGMGVQGVNVEGFGGLWE